MFENCISIWAQIVEFSTKILGQQYLSKMSYAIFIKSYGYKLFIVHTLKYRKNNV